MQHAYEDFIQLPRAAFLNMGYDPLGRVKPKWHHLLLYLYLAACLGSHLVCLYHMFYKLFEWTTLSNDISVMCHYATLVTFVVNSDTKLGTILFNRNTIRGVYERLAALYPKTTQDRVYYRVNEYYWPLRIRVLIIFYFSSCAFVILVPLIRSISVYAWQCIKLGPQMAEFPMVHGYPYFSHDRLTDSVWRYVGTYILEILHSTQMVTANIGTDLWMVCFVIQLCMHFDYLGRTLSAYQPHWAHDSNDRRFLAHLVIEHKQLFEIQNEVNTIFGGSLVLNLLTTASVLCTVGVYIIVKGVSMESMSYGLFIFTALAQFYLICYYGELMTTMSTSIGDAAYNHAWYNASLMYKKQLVLIMVRAQRPAELSALGLLPISQETFKVLLTMSYRVFALLRQMIQK